MRIKSEDFAVPAGKAIKLGKYPTEIEPIYKSKKDYKALLEEHIEELSEQQQMLYASDRHALLIILQAMDAAGKDSVIKHVMSGVNPQGCQVYSFKHPDSTEIQHDFLWRTTRALPERGRIGIFNRSYYEEVLIVRVHPEIFRAESIPDSVFEEESVWQNRYRSIVNLEHHLTLNGTRILKFFLHLSKEEQRKRFLARIDEPEKNWKFSTSDVEERKFWDQYMEAYEQCLSSTSTFETPWYIVPADDKHNTRLIISSIIVNTLKDMKVGYPRTTSQRRRELQLIRKKLAK